MANETIFFFLLLSAFVAVGVLAFLAIRYRLQLRNLRRRLRLTERRLGQYRLRLSVLRGMSVGDSGIRLRLDASEGEESLSSKMRLRLQRGQPGSSSGIVERYRLVGNMVRRGLSADDISAILQLPQAETEELLKLAQVGRTGV